MTHDRFRFCAALLRRCWLIAAILIPLAPLTASAAKDRLTIGITQFPVTLNPNLDSMWAKSYILGMAMRPLTVYDHDWNLVCMLCVELPTVENGNAKPEKTPDGRDGIAVTYRLQPDATWGDGTPVSTDDVMFTWEVGRNEAAGIVAQEFYQRILSIDIHDEKSFTMHMDRITFSYAAVNDFGLLPAHLERAQFEKNPAEYRNRTLYLTDPTQAGLYFGPYKVTDLVSNSYIVLEPNPTWWGEAPKFQRVVFKTIENTAALEANLLSGEVDMVPGGFGFSLDQALAFEQRHGDRYQFVYQQGLFYEHIDLQLENPLLQDRRVRQALLYGIDREAINRELFKDRQRVAASGVNPLDWVFSDAVPQYGYDPARAAELLDQAGWSQMRQGVRHNAAGDRLSFELMTTAGNRTRELVQQVLQSQWTQLGIEIKIHNQPPRVYFGETLLKRQHKGMAMFAWLSSPESVPRSTLHSEEIPTEANGWSGQNLTSYRNPEMDALLDRLELELDREKRKAMWAELQRIYATDLPVLPLFFQTEAHVLPPWLTNMRPTGHMGVPTLWVEQWGAAS